MGVVFDVKVWIEPPGSEAERFIVWHRSIISRGRFADVSDPRNAD